ncbi:unannotated protein [freshwater metagenome]|uniref:Unannotated protein n=1 Tax=freshwater metagenome TaxID=449393 RepID=A0A6J7QY74_9ZZZZ|nr:GNAT family N-acetyltransferase [Actinomycetota bacterium]MSW35769.1 GNAT family N-acetyltransferase [Actinomycetota bacterium]MSX38046.1 GNAT family N-acetyltransferase [Actinomycetota bacterium]
MTPTTAGRNVVAAATNTAQDLAQRAGVEVRTLHEHEELDAAREIWDSVWPTIPGATEVPSSLMRAIEHAGGYIAGAFDEGRLVGASLAFPGRSRDVDGWKEHLHSHVAAVIPAAADRGVGTAIKAHQRAWALARDIDRILWTFDPLVRRNARLNISKLGGIGAEYLIDFYGRMDDPLNSGEESDRMLVSWELASDRVSDALAGAAVPLPRGHWTALGAVVSSPSHNEVPKTARLALLPIPMDIVAIRAQGREPARQWRMKMRAALAPVARGEARVIAMTLEGDYVMESAT